jgi:hypothetical protein
VNANGNFSQAFGNTTTAAAYEDFVTGQYNVGGGTAGSWVSTDPIFEVGIGTSGTAADAVTVLKNGKFGIGTASPAQTLEVNGKVQVDSWASASATTVCENSNVLSTCSSSIRYKENVKDSPFGLNDVLKMRPVVFKWKGRDENDFGFIAEEMEKVDPMFVQYKNNQVEGVKYPQLTSVLAKAVQVCADQGAGRSREGAGGQMGLGCEHGGFGREAEERQRRSAPRF